MQTVRTSIKDLWAEGDEGFIIPYFGSDPEYGLTKDKEYKATVLSAQYGHRFKIVNDQGKESVITVDRNTDRDSNYGYGVVLPRTVYNTRANAFREANIKALREKFEADMYDLNKDHDAIWMAGNSEPWEAQ